MAVDFEKIPDCVFELFRDIMWANRENRGRTARCSNLRRALTTAWGWDPPLMKFGSDHELTMHGLAAYEWHISHLPPLAELSVEDVPKLGTNPRDWVSHEDAAKIDEVKSLREMRNQGKKEPAKQYGIDKAGRIWRTDSKGKTLYYRKSLRKS